MMFFRKLFSKKNKISAEKDIANEDSNLENPIKLLNSILLSLLGNDFTYASDILIASEEAIELKNNVFMQLHTFFEENPNYKKRIDEDKINIGSNVYKIGYLLEVVMISYSSVCQEYLIENNFLVINGAGEISLLPLVDGLLDYSSMSYEEKQDILDAIVEEIISKLTEDDFKFIVCLQTILRKLNQLNMEMDKILNGYSNLYIHNIKEYPAITCPARIDIGFNHWCKSYLSGTYSYHKSNKYITVFNVIETIKFYTKISARYSTTAIRIQNLKTILNTEVDDSHFGTTTLMKNIERANPELSRVIKNCIKAITS